MKKQLKHTFIFLLGITAVFSAFSQEKQSISIISMDTKGLNIDNETMASIMRLELEKINQFEVMDKYDVNDMLTGNDIDPATCFGKNAVVNAGKLLNADYMLTGSSELFGEKIIMVLRLIDVQKEKITTTSVMEYLNVQNEIQTMAMISINDLLGIENDPHLVDLLINYNLPITTAKTTVKLNGPRMGAAFTTGKAGKRLMASKADGGYNMFPVTSMFGYQYEVQYLSSGDFQALIEVIPTVNGLESGNFIPSLSIMNGFRFNNSGFELGLGPVFRAVKRIEGFYDADDNWTLISEVDEVPEGIDREFALDHRGELEASVGMIVAVGRTFRSGYLNIPVNLYFIPRKEGTVYGFTFGFNTSKKPRL
jgi:TolB-like protein